MVQELESLRDKFAKAGYPDVSRDLTEVLETHRPQLPPKLPEELTIFEIADQIARRHRIHPLALLQVSISPFNALARADRYTRIADLANASETEILNLRNLGKTGWQEIENSLIQIQLASPEELEKRAEEIARPKPKPERIPGQALKELAEKVRPIGERLPDNIQLRDLTPPLSENFDENGEWPLSLFSNLSRHEKVLLLLTLGGASERLRGRTLGGIRDLSEEYLKNAIGVHRGKFLKEAFPRPISS